MSRYLWLTHLWHWLALTAKLIKYYFWIIIVYYSSLRYDHATEKGCALRSFEAVTANVVCSTAPIETCNIQQWSSWRTLAAYVLSRFRIFKWKPYEPVRFICMSVCRTYPAPPPISSPIQAGIFSFAMNKQYSVLNIPPLISRKRWKFLNKIAFFFFLGISSDAKKRVSWKRTFLEIIK